MKFSVGENRQFNLIKMEYCQAKFLFPLRQKHVSAIRQANFQYDVAQKHRNSKLRCRRRWYYGIMFSFQGKSLTKDNEQ